MKQETVIKCEQCGEVLTPNKVKWLELSQTDGNYYSKIPSSHVSQGLFPFGTGCATTELKATTAALQQPQDTSTSKDELKVNYYVDGGDYQRNKDAAEVYVRKEINGEQFDVCNMACNEEPGDAYENALNIKSALANTYGKGYNPAAMEELYEALSACFIQLEKYTVLDEWDTADEEAYELSKSALKNAKTIKP